MPEDLNRASILNLLFLPDEQSELRLGRISFFEPYAAISLKPLADGSNFQMGSKAEL